MDSQDLRTRTAESARLHESALGIIPGGVSHNVRYADPYPIYIRRADGPNMWDADGNEYVDFWNNHGAGLLGHGHPDVVDRVEEQVGDGLHYGAVNEVTVELGRKIREFAPAAERLRFCASGTEATMYAVRLARAHTGRDRVLKLEGGWHGGNTDLSVAVNPPFDRQTTAGLPPGPADHVHAFRHNDRDSLAELVEEYRGEIAAVILDPQVSGVVPEEAFLDYLMDVCEDEGILTILDEIVSGIRFSPGSYHARAGVTPDLVTVGKVAGGGLPIGVLGGRAELFEPARPDVEVGPDERVIAGGGTFAMNPMTSTAGLATLEVVESEPVHEHVEALGDRARDGLNGVFEELGVEAVAYGDSSIVQVGFGLGRPPRSPTEIKTEADGEALYDYHRRMLDHGYFFNPGSTAKISYRNTEEHVDGLIEAAREVVWEMDDEGRL